MGHYDSCYEADECAKRERFNKEFVWVKKLQKKLKDVPLSLFVAQDIPLLYKLFSFDNNGSWSQFTNEDERRLRALGKKIKDRKKK